MRLLFVTAAAKIAVGLALALLLAPATPLRPEALPTWYYFALLLIFGASGVSLYLGGRSDLRARLLGVVFLLFGSIFTDRLVTRSITFVPESLGITLSVVETTHLIAFSPFAFWQFAWHFPRVPPALVGAWVHPVMMRLTLGAAIMLVVGNLITFAFGSPGSALSAFGTWLSPSTDEGLFWQLVSILTLPSLALLVAKLRAATVEERRRLGWVVVGIAVGTLPMVAHVLLVTIVQDYAAFADEPYRRRILGIVLTAFSLAIPAATAYAVVVDQVLEVRFVIRRAVQYALARYTVVTAIAGLLAAIAWVGYGNRNRPLEELFGESPVYGGLLLLAASLLFWRHALLDAIDRRFFREHYDARRILVELVDHSQQARTARDIMTLITSEVDRALHLERIALLVRDDEGDTLRDPEGRIRGLDVRGPLGTLIGGSRMPLDVDLSSESSALGRLPETEREWLADAGARLIVPLFGARGIPLGVLALGDKRSELPFTVEDRKLMTAVAASAAHALEQKLNSESPDPDTAQPTSKTHPARQCVVCGRIQDRHDAACDACGGPVQEALLPALLAGKFEIEQQIGAGGMGIVYRARDLELNRLVAMKVLPRVGPHAAARLRREARAMAMMPHPNLAVIHALESWRGAPVLVLEYLAGGTIADRLRHRPLPVSEIVAVGLVIADVLRHVHNAGFLHRDVKPSNIGYTGDGTAKLLDFGLVRLVATLSGMSTAPTRSISAVSAVATGAPPPTVAHRSHDTDQFVGTPAYMSPEAVALESPSHGVDLWGLAITMYEALTGINPFSAPTVTETVNLITAAAVPDPRELRSDCPTGLAAFLASALASDRNRRPQNAVDFIARLRAVAT